MDLLFLSKMTISAIYNVKAGQKCLTKKSTSIFKNTWGLFIKQSGITRYSYKNKEVISDPLHAVLIPPGLFHQWENVIMGDFSIVSFKSDMEYDNIIPVKIDNPKELFKRLHLLEHLFNSRQPYSKIECIIELYGIILEFIKSNNRPYLPSKNKLRIEPVTDYIERNYTKEISIETLAQMTGFSVSHFRKIFTDIYGMSPKAYILSVRMENAKKLLPDLNLSISEIAEMVGYQNIFYFSRAFKNKEKISPNEYRKSFYL